MKPVPFRGRSLAVFICYEDLFPNHVRGLQAPGEPGLLVNLTNDAWFMGTAEPAMHLALAKLRAVEQRRYLVRSTVTGKSAIVDPVGRLLGAVPEDQQGTLLADVRFLQGQTLYGLAGDLPWWGFIFGALLVAYRRRAPIGARPVSSAGDDGDRESEDQNRPKHNESTE
ncbi:MAG: nitrilase-related carbon-nitrogen hydrolase [Polyangiaceae bacterium]